MTARVHCRPAGPWSPFVHSLLRSLPDGVGPRPVSLDGAVETVTWIEGVGGMRPLSDAVRSDAALVSVARLLRRFHDAVDGAVCHNDVGPWNVVFRGCDAMALIDWDEAGPGPRVWDVALAVWHFAPLYDDDECVRVGWPVPPDRVARVRLFLDAYGMSFPGLAEAVAERQQWYLDRVLAARSDPHAPGAGPWLKVDPEVVRRDMVFLGNGAWIAEVGVAG